MSSEFETLNNSLTWNWKWWKLLSFTATQHNKHKTTQHFETIEDEGEKPQKFHKSKVCFVRFGSIFHSILLHHHLWMNEWLADWKNEDVIVWIWRRLVAGVVLCRASESNRNVEWCGGCSGCDEQNQNWYHDIRSEFELTLSRFCSLGHSHLLRCCSKIIIFVRKMNNEKNDEEWVIYKHSFFFPSLFFFLFWRQIITLMPMTNTGIPANMVGMRSLNVMNPLDFDRNSN